MIALDKLSPTDLHRYIHMQSTVYRQELASAKVRAARAYYAGDHPTQLSQRQIEYIGPMLTEGAFDFAFNIIRTVVDVVRERLTLEGFTVNGKDAGELPDSPLGAGGADPDATAAALCWNWWSDNRMDSQQARMHRRALRDGKAYCMVDYDSENQRPRFSLHEVDDGSTGVAFHRNPENENEVLFAVRYMWASDPLEPSKVPFERKNVYMPDKIMKFKRGSFGGWEQYQDLDDTEWPIPWVDRTGKPLGIALVEFQDPDQGLIAGLASLQDALNKSLLDLLAAADTSGFPVLAVEYKDANMAPMSNSSDDADLLGSDEMRIAPGRAFEVFGASIKRIEGGDLTKMIEVVWAIVSAIAVVSRLPQHDLKPQSVGVTPSGEALRALEAGLVKKCEERQMAFGQSWADVMALALKVQDAFGVASAPALKRVNIKTQWADANSRMEKAQAEIAQIHKGLGVPSSALWRTAGYSPEEIAAFKQSERLDQAVKIAGIASALKASQTNQTATPATQPTQTQTQPVAAPGAVQNA